MSKGTGGLDAGTGADHQNAGAGRRKPSRPEMPAPKVEHGLLYSSGGFLVRNDAPYVEKIYPLEQWIWNEQQHGKVWRRTIIVLEDWHEVPR